MKTYVISHIFCNTDREFDAVNHDILLTKLKYYGIQGEMVSWFKLNNVLMIENRKYKQNF
jgi:hypothetical protein